MKKLKQVLYIISIIPPIIDLLKGAYIGLKKGLHDITTGNTIAASKERARWEEANRG